MSSFFNVRSMCSAAISGCLLLGIAGCNPDDPKEEEVFDEALNKVVLTEINYNPVDNGATSADSLEFVELKNTGSGTVSLSSLRFTDGIIFAFPENTELAANGFYVIASNATAFKARYGKDPDGVFYDNLSNSGEMIVLRDTVFNQTIFSQTYSDSGLWTNKADGNGYSLVSVVPSPDRLASGPTAWKKSAKRYGSPGADDPVVSADPTLFNLRFTEVHYNPIDLDGKKGDSLEFIEIKNIGTTSCDLSRCAITNGVDFTFPAGSTLAAGQYVVLASYLPYFKLRYPSVTPLGQYSGSLNNSGEKVTLFDVQGDTAVASIDYKDSGAWPGIADGEGPSLVSIDPANVAEQNVASGWRRSFAPNGSPGADDAGVVLVNEVLTHTDLPNRDAVELYNPGKTAVNIGGWYLTDSKANPAKYKIPDGTEIPAGGYKVFDETEFNVDSTSPLAFTFNSHGEGCWIFSNPALGCSEAYCDGFTFGELENAVSVGRYINSEGKERVVAMKGLTLGAKNSEPLVGPLVISEIMYGSPDNAADFIEITNIGAVDVSLSHPEFASFTWKVTGLNGSFPSGKTVKPGEAILIASDSLTEEVFRNRYKIDAAVQVFRVKGGLKNGSETIELLKPEDPYTVATAPTDTLYPYMLFDKVTYSDGKPWPVEADGLGLSLHRTAKNAFGDDLASWKAAVPTPGKVE